MFDSSKQKKLNEGYLLVLVLVMGAVFLLLISGFIGNVTTQSKVVNLRFEQQRLCFE